MKTKEIMLIAMCQELSVLLKIAKSKKSTKKLLLVKIAFDLVKFQIMLKDLGYSEKAIKRFCN